jgi:hypothetical protein
MDNWKGEWHQEIQYVIQLDTNKGEQNLALVVLKIADT